MSKHCHSRDGGVKLVCERTWNSAATVVLIARRIGNILTADGLREKRKAKTARNERITGERGGEGVGVETDMKTHGE